MARVILTEITDRAKPTLYELRSLYRNNVCNNISDPALNIFTQRELKRHLVISIYREEIKFKARQRSLIVKKISMLLGVSLRMVEYLCPKKIK